MADNESQGISRRDLLKRGAALGGAVVWATPVVQTLGMGRAFAQTASPVETGISFIIMNVTCTSGTYFVRWETESGFEDNPGNNNPGCQLSSTGTPINGEDLPEGPIQISIKSNGCAEIILPSGCSLQEGKVYGGGSCQPITDLSNVCL